MRTLALMAAALVVLGLAAAAPATSIRPRIWVSRPAPLTIRGAHFQPGERVTVTATVKARYVHRLTASATGTFRTRFLALELGACAGYSVKATGDLGSRALIKVVPDCPEPGPTD